MPKSPPDSEKQARLVDEDDCQIILTKLAKLPWREVNTIIGKLHQAPKVKCPK